MGITAFVPRPLTSGSKAQGRFGKPDFVYLEQENVYRCPAGEDLIYRYTSVEDGLASAATSCSRVGRSLRPSGAEPYENLCMHIVPRITVGHMPHSYINVRSCPVILGPLHTIKSQDQIYNVLVSHQLHGPRADHFLHHEMPRHH
jgi:hypothetical protein